MRKENRGAYAADRIVNEGVRSCWGGKMRQRVDCWAKWVSICTTSCGLLGFGGKRLFGAGCPETQACAPA